MDAHQFSGLVIEGQPQPGGWIIRGGEKFSGLVIEGRCSCRSSRIPLAPKMPSFEHSKAPLTLHIGKVEAGHSPHP